MALAQRSISPPLGLVVDNLALSLERWFCHLVACDYESADIEFALITELSRLMRWKPKSG